ncbi:MULTISPECIES: polysaccharide deacetylase family protein [unclassified Microbacterium]|uniref:polysaccharide deacetylase family protein n=1 Tax=unclassified Microbacterium TaxID=2609290 RepID=UPI0030169CC9
MGSTRTHRTPITRVWAIGLLLGAAVTGLSGCAGPADPQTPDAAEISAASPTPTATPQSAAEKLLADNAATPGACAVSFVLDGTTLDPQLQVQDRLYDHLPIPRQDGRAFAGWYGDPAAAAAATADPTTGAGNPAVRINGSDLVSCTDHQTTLYGAWTTPAAAAAAKARVPILMYHQFTDKPGGEDGWLRGNYTYIEDYRAHMQYIKDQAFYLPTWDELSAFIDGALYLPDHSVIVTDDDADPTWLTMASPINEQLEVMATSFDITVDGAAPQNRFILPRSHTNAMHTAGANGKGQMVNLSAAEIAADMTASADALRGIGVTAGATEIMAYPYGHTNDTAKEGLREAGFEMARTIEQGYVEIGSEKLALPCIRINYGMGVADLKDQIG